ncbi:PA0069 family radical SAM protein [Pseudoxanthomonas daejeonensis]|uniref:Radical SAM protein n=1 Tax=Pseudoxanthomonas daejeonensis TaxID=266062 RepID=A0ABQ6ZC76_9GAMM|nr:PA0069 family radical SAM protein [Pseudoxanthomonas daejeonensis]KAF1697634.1 radical SAM protein [Pseudoxanthomonas daejeonensis]UNK58741.1 PA0069 family radical SAM protein [Pseudoxanthomonas daejeonensis]
MADTIKGRGSRLHLPGRFERSVSERVDDGWTAPDEPESGPDPLRPRTEVFEETARSIISRNDSPDVGFSQSVNPYRGCEHGCSYCFARPSHAYLNLSPGLDFETKIFAKTNAAELLRREFARPGYRPSPIALGINTDAYQPAERRLQITRRLIEVMLECRHPFSLITKNALVERDLDLLQPLAEMNLVRVHFSVTTLDPHLSARLEPRAAAPHARLRAMQRLHECGIPVGVLFAPAIPWVNDHEMEAVLAAAREAGADSAGYVLLRLPHEVAPLFRDWLQAHVPDRADRVMAALRQMRGGRDYESNFGTRMRGRGEYADLLAQRFALALRRNGYDPGRPEVLDCSRFLAPRRSSPQGELF